jgi:DNA-binding HxlR family transcriptional regulator
VERKSFVAMDCSVAQCLEVIGEWWTMLVVRDCFMGVTRFEDFQRRLGISRNILHLRLTTLVDAGILIRVPYSLHPPRDDYKLTAKGLDLWPVLTAMRQWGDEHAAPNGPPVTISHTSCGEVAHAVMVCEHCREQLHARDVRLDVGASRLTGPSARVTSVASP